MSGERVLLVEDEDYVRDSTAELLREEGLEVACASSVDEALDVLGEEPVDVILTDLRLPGADGLALLDHPAVRSSALPVVVLTGHGTVADAVEAMKGGAWDFLQKPVDPERLAIVLRRALQHGRLQGEVRRLRTAVHRLSERHALAGSSPAMERVRRLVEQVAATDATVLVSGESGTGKELVAAEVHRRSRRARGPLVLVNCAAIPESLFESELFGHRRGAFTGAVADRAGRFAEAQGGTLVLDEIEALPSAGQAKLLRVLETGEYQMVGESRTRVVDARVVAVTNEDLAARVEEGTFRGDLYWRLNVFPIELPPLRDHPQDLPEIAVELLARVHARTGLAPADAAPPALDADAVAALAGYGWPGNVRELRNVLERALILSGPDRTLDAELLRSIVASAPAPRGAEAGDGGLDLRARLAALERQLVERALAATAGRKKEAAELLGIDPKNLAYYLRKHGRAEA